MLHSQCSGTTHCSIILCPTNFSLKSVDSEQLFYETDDIITYNKSLPVPPSIRFYLIFKCLVVQLVILVLSVSNLNLIESRGHWLGFISLKPCLSTYSVELLYKNLCFEDTVFYSKLFEKSRMKFCTKAQMS